MASWKGYLKLSLVACPVRLYPAVTEANRIRFHLINPATGNRIQMRAHDAETGEEVPRSELVKGYEFERHRYVTVSDDELKQIQIEGSKTIEIERFVDTSDVDIVYFDSPYYVVPDGKVAAEAFKVIRDAMQEQSVAGLGRVVLTSREHPLILQPSGKGIMLNTLRSASELRDASDYFDAIPDDPVDRRMVDMAKAIMAQIKGKFDPAAFEDRYQEALRDLIQAKVRGEKPAVRPVERGAEIINLMDALKRSLGDVEPRKSPASGRRPAAARGTKPKRAKRKAG